MNFLRPLRFRQQLGEIDRRLQRVSRPHLDVGVFDELIYNDLGVFAEAEEEESRNREFDHMRRPNAECGTAATALRVN